MLHLLKLAVGADSLADLAFWQADRLSSLRQISYPPELMHITRHTPKRAEEILDGGSLFWIVKGRIAARQRILAFRPVLKHDQPHCGLIYDRELIRVRPYPHRPFQGWRYLNADTAPPDIGPWSTADDADPLQRDLLALGLL